MDNNQLREFYGMQEQMKTFSKEQAEMRQEIRDGFARNDEKHDEIMKHFTAEMANLGVIFGKELEKKSDKWVETVLKFILSGVGMAILGAIGYAIVHAYKTM